MHEFLAREQGDVDVPEISDADLAARAKLYRALVVKDGHTYEITQPDPRGMAYTFDPKVLRPVDFMPRRAQWTDFTCGYYGFFKPTIAEILAQIPDGLAPGTNAFLIDPRHLIGIYRSGSGQRAIVQWGEAVSKDKRSERTALYDYDGEVTRRDKPFKDPEAILGTVLDKA